MSAPTQKQVYALAVAKGFHTAHHGLIAFLHEHGAPEYMIEHARATWLATRLALIHAEVSEALELVRKGGDSIADELADIVLRTKDLAEDTGVDLDKAEELKHAYNATRPHKHGGKVL